jgi:hypothetical protein
MRYEALPQAGDLLESWRVVGALLAPTGRKGTYRADQTDDCGPSCSSYRDVVEP